MRAVWGKDFVNRSGETPWLSFISKWYDLPFEENPFTSGTEDKDDPCRMLILYGYSPLVTTNNQTYPYAEMYFVKKGVDYDWSKALVFSVYLDNERQRARIELFKTEYVDQADKFMTQLDCDHLDVFADRAEVDRMIWLCPDCDATFRQMV